MGAGSDLVDQDSTLLIEEKLDGQKAHKIHGLHHRQSDAARFIFNEARKVYYARKDRSSSPGAPAKKRSKPLAGFKPPDKSPDREPADAPAEETAEEKEQRERATSDADHKLDALLDG